MSSRSYYYRNNYLRSDHWQNLRLQRLVKSKCRCALCGKEDISNDVHHVNYRNLKDVRISDLRVLCRKCHDQVHEVMTMEDDYKRIMGSYSRWAAIRRRIKIYRALQSIENHKDRLKLALELARCRNKYKTPDKARRDFRLARKLLIHSNAISNRKYEMPWNNLLFLWFAAKENPPTTDEILLASWFAAWPNIPQCGEH